MKRFQVLANNGHSFGVFLATDEQAARDACARDSGYESEADMIELHDGMSHLVARDVTEILAAIPGHAQQVYNGWIWGRWRGGHEYPWSRGATREQCEHTVLLVVEREGVEDALEIDD